MDMKQSPDEEEKIVEGVKKYVHTLFADNAGGHDEAHTLRVYNNAIFIAKNESEGNLLYIRLAALLHDADDKKIFITENNSNTRYILDSLGVHPEEIDAICKIINAVSFSMNKENHVETPEAAIVQDADRLEAMGAIGIARTFAYGGEHGRPLESSVEHFYDKLLLLRENLNTKTAREMAESRHVFMEEFLQRLHNEMALAE